MLTHLGLLALGLVVLYFGAEWLIKGASSLAVGLGIPPLVVGLTVVALGTSLPEFMTNVFAATMGEDSLAVGNIVGSNIANIGLILGSCALLVPLTVAPSALRREYPIMLGGLVLFYLLALDGEIGRLDGLILLSGLAAFLAYLIWDVRRRAMDTAEAAPELEMPTWRKLLLLGGGALALALGAHLMVQAAVAIAKHHGIDPIVIGLTIVAVGTSLPELAASLVGVFRDEPDLAFGNVIGSNLLNVLFVVGLVALISPTQVRPVALQLHFPVMLGFGVLVALAWRGHRLRRWHGAVLLLAFVGYMAMIVVLAPLM